eukprot:1759000-Amphidinium_carterae.1
MAIPANSIANAGSRDHKWNLCHQPDRYFDLVLGFVFEMFTFCRRVFQEKESWQLDFTSHRAIFHWMVSTMAWNISGDDLP